jgi:hypothetical protein
MAPPDILERILPTPGFSHTTLNELAGCDCNDLDTGVELDPASRAFTARYRIMIEDLDD